MMENEISESVRTAAKVGELGDKKTGLESRVKSIQD
jgi:hypothetical protein